MKQNNLISMLLAITFTFFTQTANAALVSRLGGQAIYDTDLDITWLSDVNLGSTNTFGVSGIDANGNMTWDTANSWINAMNLSNHLGFNNWRMPFTADPDFTCNDNPGGGGSADAKGFDCTNSEMGHLFYNELDGTGAVSILNSTDPDVLLFSNITTTGGQHWSGTELFSFPSFAWTFSIEGTGASGQQNTAQKSGRFSVLPVRNGDVGIVPVPAAVWLFGSGLIGLIGIARRKKA